MYTERYMHAQGAICENRGGNDIFYEVFLIRQKLYLMWSQFNKNIVGI